MLDCTQCTRAEGSRSSVDCSSIAREQRVYNEVRIRDPFRQVLVQQDTLQFVNVNENLEQLTINSHSKCQERCAVAFIRMKWKFDQRVQSIATSVRIVHVSHPTSHLHRHARKMCTTQMWVSSGVTSRGVGGQSFVRGLKSAFAPFIEFVGSELLITRETRPHWH